MLPVRLKAKGKVKALGVKDFRFEEVVALMDPGEWPGAPA